MKNLETILGEEVSMNKVLVFGDKHIPFDDKKAYNVMIQYAKNKYKPDIIVLLGDILDFYSLSKFDKNPNRVGNIQEDLNSINDMLYQLRKDFPKSKIYLEEGNHEARLKKYLWRHAELLQLDALKLESLLELKKNDIKYIGSDPDYWSMDAGHLKLGDVIIMHGDNRINGAKGGKYASQNTMLSVNHKVVMGHTHRLNVSYYDNKYVNLFAINTGCMCMLLSMSDWQVGFATFELDNGKGINPRVHQIFNGTLYIDDKFYK